MENSTPLCNGKESNADKVQDSETSLFFSKKADKNYLDDSERTQKSSLDVVFELLATTTGTRSSNSLVILSDIAHDLQMATVCMLAHISSL